MLLNKTKLKLKYGKTKLFVKRNAPTILTVLSVISTVGLLITSSIAGSKEKEVLEYHTRQIKDIRESLNDQSKINTGAYSKEQSKKDLRKLYTRTVVKTLKIYAPSLLLLTISTGCAIGSHKILTDRNVALSTSLAAVTQAYSSYRDRVAKEIGEEKEKEIFENGKKKIITKDKDGNEIVTEVPNNDITDREGDYLFMFHSGITGWLNNAQHNIDTLISYERNLNNKLRAQGYLLLEDVYNQLGVEQYQLTDRQLQMSKVVGWIYDPDDENHRDSYVSFGLTVAPRITSSLNYEYSPRALEYLKNDDAEILLEFNPDGDIVTGPIDPKTGKPAKTFMKYIKGRY